MRAAGLRAAASSPGRNTARAPDAAEVVDPHHPLDEVEVDLEKRSACGHAGVVDEEVERGVPLEDARCERLDCGAVADVAELDLGADLVGEGAQPILPARDEHTVPSRRG